MDNFSRKISQSMHGPSGPSRIRTIHIANVRTASGDNDAKFLPMDHNGLSKMLNVHAGALPDGVIQKFVGVTGEVHTVFRVQWEESLFKVSKVLMDTAEMNPGLTKPASQEGVSNTLQVELISNNAHQRPQYNFMNWPCDLSYFLLLALLLTQAEILAVTTKYFVFDTLDSLTLFAAQNAWHMQATAL